MSVCVNSHLLLEEPSLMRFGHNTGLWVKHVYTDILGGYINTQILPTVYNGRIMRRGFLILNGCIFSKFEQNGEVFPVSETAVDKVFLRGGAC